MSSLTIASKRHRYTSGTHFLAEWLVATSLAGGYSLRRLKQESVANEADEFSKAEYLIPIRSYDALAQFVANIKPPIVIPRTVISALEEVIRLREETRAELLLMCRPVDAGHDHIIDVMRSVRMILRQRAPEPTSFTSNDNTVENTQNSFTSLALGEVSQELSSRMPQTPASPRRKNVLAAQLPDDIHEAQLGFISMTQDFITISAIVRKLWVDFGNIPPNQRDHVALLRATITTETAIQAAHMMEAETTTLFEKHGGAIKLMEALYSEGRKATSDVAKQVKEWYELYRLLLDFRSKSNSENVLKTRPDWIVSAEAAMTENQSGPQPRNVRLLRILPAMFLLRRNVQRIDFANASGSVLRMAHMYHAGRLTHYLDTPWSEMEQMMASQRTESLFVGSERPTDPTQVFPRYNLATGASIVIFSQGRRQVGNPRSRLPKEKLKRLQSATPVLIGLTEQVQALNKNPANSGFPRVIAAMARDPTCNTVPLAATLENLANAVMKEVPAASIDYFRLHRQS
ncbi:hypothetical protein DL769_003284 [Monosporascus sp. CRB-8-3]|nr:hypothetical protein DL769_003284 [Monosporascus sp. CRB-8-3]